MKDILQLFNPFQIEHDIHARLTKSQILLYILLMGFIAYSVPYIRGTDDLETKILYGVGAAYLIFIGAYILKTFDRAISEVRRNEDKIKELKKEIDALKKA